MRSVEVSYGTKFESMTVIFEIDFKMQVKISGPQNIGHYDLHLIVG